MKRRRRVPYPIPTYTVSHSTVFMRDPIDGTSHQWDVEHFDLLMMFWKAAVKFNLTIAQLWHISCAVDPQYSFRMEALIELKERMRVAERDAALLKLKDQLSIEELLAARERAVEGLRWYREHFVDPLPPARKAEVEAKLAEQEAEIRKELEAERRQRNR
jgi:hypothetical protein